MATTNQIRPEKQDITIGFMPLLDSAPIIWAHHRGYFEKFGLNVQLAREVSWASLRDRLAYGALDAAQCLAPMILASNLGADQVGVPFVSALTLTESWAAITLSKSLADKIQSHGRMTPQESAHAIANYLKQGHALKLAHVFQYSMHHYLLREWLSYAGIDDQAADVSYITVPPPQMVNQLQLGNIDGFCVGEPWNTVASSSGIGRVINTAPAIFPHAADKVLGVTQEWAERYPITHQAMVSAVLMAQQELTTDLHYPKLAQVLESYNVINLPEEWVNNALNGTIVGIAPRFMAGQQARPKPADYAWISLQMIRWQQWTKPINVEQMALNCCGLASFDQAYPLSNLKNEQFSLPTDSTMTLAQAREYLVSKGWNSSDAEKMLIASE